MNAQKRSLHVHAHRTGDDVDADGEDCAVTTIALVVVRQEIHRTEVALIPIIMAIRSDEERCGPVDVRAPAEEQEHGLRVAHFRGRVERRGPGVSV